jgi:hypothetical protein
MILAPCSELKAPCPYSLSLPPNLQAKSNPIHVDCGGDCRLSSQHDFDMHEHEITIPVECIEQSIVEKFSRLTSQNHNCARFSVYNSS